MSFASRIALRSLGFSLLGLLAACGSGNSSDKPLPAPSGKPVETRRPDRVNQPRPVPEIEAHLPSPGSTDGTAVEAVVTPSITAERPELLSQMSWSGSFLPVTFVSSIEGRRILLKSETCPGAFAVEGLTVSASLPEGTPPGKCTATVGLEGEGGDTPAANATIEVAILSNLTLTAEGSLEQSLPPNTRFAPVKIVSNAPAGAPFEITVKNLTCGPETAYMIDGALSGYVPHDFAGLNCGAEVVAVSNGKEVSNTLRLAVDTAPVRSFQRWCRIPEPAEGLANTMRIVSSGFGYDLYNHPRFDQDEMCAYLANDLADAEEIDLSYGGKIDLRPLFALENLKTLNLTGNRDVNQAHLARLPALTGLVLSDNGLETVGSLGTLAGLETLDLSNNPLKDLAGLGSLVNLQALNLNATGLRSIEGLPLDKLHSLLVSENPALASLEALRNLTALRTLNVTSTGVTSLEPLSGPVGAGLRELFASSTKVEDASPLAAMPLLEALSLAKTRVASIDSLGTATKLTLLDLGGSRVADLGVLRGLASLQLVLFQGSRVRTSTCPADAASPALASACADLAL